MAIADRLNKLRTDIENTYQAINEIGGTIPSDKNTNNIPEAIRSVYNNLPKVSDTGTNVSLNPTLKGRLGIVPKGNTYQYATTGKNLLDTSITSQTINGITITKNSDGSITLNGTTIATFNIEWKINNITLPAGTYYIGLGTTTNSFNLYFNKSGGGFEVLGNPASSSYYTLTLNEETTYTGLKSYVGSGITFNNVTFYPMITKTLPFTYEKYTGGHPAPRPDFPMDIQSATGTQKVVVSGKNLANINEIEKTSNATIELNDNGFTYTRISASSGDLFVATLSKQLKPNTTYSTYMTKDTGNFLYFYADKLFGNSLQRNQIAYTAEYIAYTFTTDSTGYVVIGFYSTNSSQGGTGTIGNIVLTEGVKTIEELQKYQPYQEPQEVDIELGNLELNKIGDYEDYIGGTPDNWVLYKNIGKVVLDGNNYKIISKSGTSNNNMFFTSVIENILKPASNSGVIQSYSNCFTPKSIDNMYVNNILGIGVNRDGAIGIGVTLENQNNTVALINTWLLSNNVEIIYPLAETQQTPITDTNLISQLNELYYLQSYNDTTNIDVTGNLPMRITASAIKGE